VKDKKWSPKETDEESLKKLVLSEAESSLSVVKSDRKHLRYRLSLCTIKVPVEPEVLGRLESKQIFETWKEAQKMKQNCDMKQFENQRKRRFLYQVTRGR
jgi:hypothetical protein